MWKFAESYAEAAEQKKASLPISRCSFGYVQRSKYVQLDSHDEVVVDIETPFAAVVPSGAWVVTLLLLGDQNAGKSTFLHSFCHSEDKSFTLLMSKLPIVSASFLNTRFLVDESAAFIDEIPFLDTDIARGTVMMTLEDWALFHSDNGMELSESEIPADTRYVVLQLIEIGGDHLDRLIKYDSDDGKREESKRAKRQKVSDDADQDTLGILQKSLQLLSNSARVLYFVNLTQLCDFDSAYEPSVDVWDDLVRRLRFLASHLASGTEILITLSRMPPHDTILSKETHAKWREMATLGKIDDAKSSMSLLDTVKSAFNSLMQTDPQLSASDLSIADIVPIHTINDADGSIDVEAVTSMLSTALKLNLVHSSSSNPLSLTTEHVWACWDSLSLDLDDDGEESISRIWIDSEVFRSYLDEQPLLEAPALSFYQSFSVACHNLVRRHMALSLSEHMRFRVIVRIDGKRKATIFSNLDGECVVDCSCSCSMQPQTLKRRDEDEDEDDATASVIRFPSWKPLYQCLRLFGSRNVPAEVWMARSDSDNEEALDLTWMPPAFTARLQECIDGLEKKIMQETNPHAFLNHVEEWWLARRLWNRECDSKLHAGDLAILGSIDASSTSSSSAAVEGEDSDCIICEIIVG